MDSGSDEEYDELMSDGEDCMKHNILTISANVSVENMSDNLYFDDLMHDLEVFDEHMSDHGDCDDLMNDAQNFNELMSDGEGSDEHMADAEDNYGHMSDINSYDEHMSDTQDFDELMNDAESYDEDEKLSSVFPVTLDVCFSAVAILPDIISGLTSGSSATDVSDSENSEQNYSDEDSSNSSQLQDVLENFNGEDNRDEEENVRNEIGDGENLVNSSNLPWSNSLIQNSTDDEIVGDNISQEFGLIDNENTYGHEEPLSETASSQQGPVKDNGKVDDGMTCSVCLDAFTNSGPHRIVSLRCGHLFGKSCVERWLKFGCKGGVRRCPTCNRKAHRKDIRVIYARKLQAMDTSEKDRIQMELDKVKEEKSRLETDLTKMRQNFNSNKAFTFEQI